MFAIEDLFEAANRVGHRNLFSFTSGEDLGHAERLTEKTLNLARPQNRQLVFRREFIHSQNRDDVLKILVTL